MTQISVNVSIATRKAVVVVAWLSAFAHPSIGSAQNTKPLEFDVASVKPAAPESRGTRVEIQPDGGAKISNYTLKTLITMSYQLRDFQVSGGPGWMNSDRYDIEAKSEPIGPAPDPRTSMDEQGQERQKRFHERVRSLLADRFQLKAHQETKEMPVYYLVQAKGGSKLKQVGPEPNGNRGMRMQRGSLAGMFATIDMLADILAGTVGRPVIDKTGLTGKFDWKLEWMPESGPGQQPVLLNGQPVTPPDVSGPSLFTALQEQLGLKLESQRGTAPILIIDRAEKPSAN